MKKKSSVSTLFFLFILTSLFCLSYYIFFSDNIQDIPGEDQRILYIHTGESYPDVLDSLNSQNVLNNPYTFGWVAGLMGYAHRVHPGKYIVSRHCGNLMLIRRLRSGLQDAVKITFSNIEDKNELADKISAKLEAPEQDLLDLFKDPGLLDSLHLTEASFPTIFITNTYEFYWNTSARQFIGRMLKEYRKFWTEERLAKARALGLSPAEVSILASVIQKESNHYDEYPLIAGVYLNRLRKGMPLQADPTVLFAMHKIGLQHRVYSQDLKMESPYNTYLHRGLPPGPICLPEIKSIDLTLDAQKHNYMYFCAKPDFSGYHVFAATWEEHLQNARQYQKALNEHNIH